MAYQLGKVFECRECGKEVTWCESKSGKRYLGQPSVWRGEDVSKSKTFYPKHDCVPDPEYKERMEALEAERIKQRIAAGEPDKDIPVVVVKGQKVPIGTRGIVFWRATEPDRYGNIRIGMFDTDGNKHFLPMQNVQVVSGDHGSES